MYGSQSEVIAIRTRRRLTILLLLMIVLGAVILGGYRIYQNLKGTPVTKDHIAVGTSVDSEDGNIQGAASKFRAGQSIVVYPQWKATTDSHSDQLTITNLTTHDVVLEKQWDQLYPGGGLEIPFRETTRGDYLIQFYRDSKLQCSTTVTFY